MKELGYALRRVGIHWDNLNDLEPPRIEV
jgi:hypothetical protein